MTIRFRATSLWRLGWAVLIAFVCQLPPALVISAPHVLVGAFAYEEFPTGQARYKSPLDTEVAGNLLQCTSEAGGRHEFGDAFVRIDEAQIKIESTPRVGSATRKCLETAARKLVDLERRRPGGWRVTAYLADLPVGVPGPLFEDSAGLLNAWRRYRTSPGIWRSWALKRRLPDEIVLRGDGCLTTRGSSYGANVKKAVDIWLEQLTPGRVSPLWRGLLELGMAPEKGSSFSRVYLVAPDLFLKVANGRLEPATLCLEPVSAEQRSALRRRMNEVGTCLPNDLETALVAPRYAFPTTEVASSVSTNGSGSCAVGSAGTVTCCGRTSALTASVPADRFRQVEILVDRDAACGVTTSGATKCWGQLPEQPPTIAAVDRLCSHSTCTIGRQGDLGLLWSQNPRVPDAVQGHVLTASVQPLDFACAIVTTGTLRCWDPSPVEIVGPGQLAGWGPPTGDWKSVALGPRAVCATNDVSVQCWESHGTHRALLTTGALSSPVVTSSDTLCGLERSGAVRCERLFQDSRLPDLPSANIAFRTLSEGGGLLCGVDREGRASCWGRAWPDPAPSLNAALPRRSP